MDQVVLDRPITMLCSEPDTTDRSVTVMQPQAFPISTDPTPRDLVRMAMAQGGDLEQIARFLQLQREWDADMRARESHEAMKEFNRAFAAFKAMPMTIFKRKHVGYTTKEGEFVGYTHAELSDITDVIAPELGRQGLSYRWDIKQAPNLITVTCILSHALGHSIEVAFSAAPDTSGKKNAIQSQASAVQYLQRYTLLAVTGMSTKGMDDDGRTAGDREKEDIRRRWIEDQKKNIKGAATLGALKKIMSYGLDTCRLENDSEAEDELIQANAEKLSTLPIPQTTESQK